MYLGIDHLVIAVADPDDAVAMFERAVAPAPTGGGRHDALGTFNRVVWLGDSYVEFIGVFDPTLAATSWVGAPALRALETGGGFATWAIATDDLDGGVGQSQGGRIEPRRGPPRRATSTGWRSGSLAAGGARPSRPSRAAIPDRARRDGRRVDDRRPGRSRGGGGAPRRADRPRDPRAPRGRSERGQPAPLACRRASIPAVAGRWWRT